MSQVTVRRSGFLYLPVLASAVVVLLLAPVARAVITDALVNGDLEASPFDQGWASPEATAHPGLIAGSTQAARVDVSVNGSGSWGLSQGGLLSANTADWTLDLLFAADDPNGGTRSFHLLLGSENSTNAINLRVDANGAIQVFDGVGWQTLTANGTVAFSTQRANPGAADPGDFVNPNVYRLVLTGIGWNGVSPSYSVQLSDVNNPATLSLVAENIAHFHANPSGGVSLVAFGDQWSSADYVVDEVSLTFDYVPPPLVIRPFSGIYPHLAMRNTSNECGVGAISIWAERLWAVTYSPHEPRGSSDKLYEIATDLTRTIRPESVGGTPANRMVHHGSDQLVIGHHFIDSNGTVRTVSPSTMPGRMTSVTNHLTDPNKVYFLTMEEGVYEVDANTLSVTQIHKDLNGGGPNLVPGNHGKGGYAGQGMLVYSNNGSGGCLAEWDGVGDGGDSSNWTIVDRNKYTDITGPNGPEGPYNATDPIWAIGWDSKSVLLNIRDSATDSWRRVRLPKASYTHDPDQGWYTEWPRIRDVNLSGGDYLMCMHGMFYGFPNSMSTQNLADLRPISRHQKMIVDYTDWSGQLVLATNDASKFGNPLTRLAQSNLVFTTTDSLTDYGKPAGWGGPWAHDSVSGGAASESFFIGGFRDRVLHIAHGTDSDVTFDIEINSNGLENWGLYRQIVVPANSYRYVMLPGDIVGDWLRLVPNVAADDVTAYCHLFSGSHPASRALTASLAPAMGGSSVSQGVLRLKALGGGSDAMTLQFAADLVDSNGAMVSSAYYELGSDQVLRNVDDAATEATVRSAAATSAHFTLDDASVVVTDNGGNRYRLPRGDARFDAPTASGWPRGIREIVTERALMNIHGTFYELPFMSSNSNPFAGKNFRRIKPITTHNLRIFDYASWRGVMVLTGNLSDAVEDNHFIRSDDGQVGLWLGSVDDLWRFGPPRGVGGPWMNTAVTADTPSDPYLMFGYSRKELKLSHDDDSPVTMTVEVDVLGDNSWHTYDTFVVPSGAVLTHDFPAAYQAHWLRVRCDRSVNATCQLEYGLDGCERTRDLNADGDVGVDDAVAILQCLSGPGQPPNPLCVLPTIPSRDFDDDGDVDLIDFQKFAASCSACGDCP